MDHWHEATAEDAKADPLHCLEEARLKNCHSSELTYQSHKETEQTNKHPELYPGVGRDLLSEAKNNF